ncbi:MAG: hypothetical protein QOH39_2901 [Verrucomicrobiota bacterium]
MSIMRRLFISLLLLAAPLTAALAQQTNAAGSSGSNSFTWTNLQSDINGVAFHTDSHLINPWGITIQKTGTIWVNDNGTGVSTVYNLDGTPAASNPVINIPKSASNSGTANPTGIVANPTALFKVTKAANMQPAGFIFVSEDGSISGWNATLDPANAIVAVDNGASGAVYKGAALSVATTTTAHSFLYVTNFHSGKVEMYNETFQRADTSTTFTDPNLPAGFAPFGIANKGGQIYVTYAKQDANKHDDVPGAGNGFINVFDTAGTFVKRLVSNGNLDSPWGLAFIAGQFGRFKGAMYVGNFGDGQINAYDPAAGTFLGTLRKSDGSPLIFEGLWDLAPGNGGLYFSAGIVGEAHGLFGLIVKGK